MTRRQIVASLVAAPQAPRFSKEQIHYVDRLAYDVAGLDAPGWILDVGGGGEGVIGRMYGSRVVAIDPIARELAEAPAGPLKIVMDGRELKFLDGAFQTATAFFTFMYIPRPERPRVMKEIHRVLAPGGRLRLWDVEQCGRTDKTKEVIVYRFSFKLPAETVQTGYGTFWPDEPYGVKNYLAIAEEAGFQVVSRTANEHVFSLELVRKA
jgi:ubiquinone/menaquinone biosynthesis C-methylase UbiE